MTPLEKISATLSFVIYFAHRFLRKKLNGRRKFCHRKKIEKKYMGGSPESPNLAKILKNISKNINLPVCCHFTIWRDKLNLKVDSESLDMYLTPCKKAKRSKTYFSCYRRLKLAYFCRFRGRDELSQKFVFLTIFYFGGSTSKRDYSKSI